jgi:hypothetical protein
VESMALRYLPGNHGGKQKGDGANTRWYPLNGPDRK